MKSTLTTEEYIDQLTAKGFVFREDSLGFIEFGKQYTASSDYLVNVAVEITLMAQKQFDGSFFVSLLEMLKAEKIETKQAALQLVKDKNIM